MLFGKLGECYADDQGEKSTKVTRTRRAVMLGNGLTCLRIWPNNSVITM